MDAQEFSLHLCSTCGNQYNSQAKLKKHTSLVHDLNPESCKHEVEHGYVVKKKQGTPTHLLKSLQSISSYNSLRIGSTPPQDFTLRRKSTPSPHTTPKVKQWSFPKSLLSRYPLPSINE